MELIAFGKELLQSAAEQVASYKLGQTALRQLDKTLWVLEKSSRWAVPPPLDQDERPQPELVRPLSWVFFLPLLVMLRITRESISLINLVMGKPPLRSADMVSYIQGKRRYLRTLKYQGNRMMRARSQSTTRQQSWYSNMQSLFEFTMCFKRHTANNNSTTVSNNEQILVVKRTKKDRNNMDTTVTASNENTMERLIEKMMVDLNADSEDDSSYTLTNATSYKTDSEPESEQDTIFNCDETSKPNQPAISTPQKSDPAAAFFFSAHEDSSYTTQVERNVTESDVAKHDNADATKNDDTKERVANSSNEKSFDANNKNNTEKNDKTDHVANSVDQESSAPINKSNTEKNDKKDNVANSVDQTSSDANNKSNTEKNDKKDHVTNSADQKSSDAHNQSNTEKNDKKDHHVNSSDQKSSDAINKNNIEKKDKKDNVANSVDQKSSDANNKSNKEKDDKKVNSADQKSLGNNKANGKSDVAKSPSNEFGPIVYDEPKKTNNAKEETEIFLEAENCAAKQTTPAKSPKFANGRIGNSSTKKKDITRH